jgi:hypothetical protein
MLTPSQVLTVLGIILELISVFVSIRKLFWGYNKRIDEIGTAIQDTIRKDKTEGIAVLILLIVGMALQATAVLL